MKGLPAFPAAGTFGGGGCYLKTFGCTLPPLSEIVAAQSAGANFASQCSANATKRRCREFGRLATIATAPFEKVGGRHESTRSESAMSSPEELTFVVGRWLCGLVFVLDVVRRLKAAPISSREQVSTRPNH